MPTRSTGVGGPLFGSAGAALMQFRSKLQMHKPSSPSMQLPGILFEFQWLQTHDGFILDFNLGHK